MFFPYSLWYFFKYEIPGGIFMGYIMMNRLEELLEYEFENWENYINTGVMIRFMQME